MLTGRRWSYSIQVTALTVQDVQVVVLAEAETPAGSGNARGHLFERFIAHVLERLGYNQPTLENLNVTKDGIELDVSARHRLNNRRALAECKAYGAAISAKELTSFYGKLVAERLVSSDQIDGFFFALPRLTNSGAEQAAKIESKDPDFRYLSSNVIARVAQDAGLLAPIPSEFSDELSSDYAVIITDHGIFAALKRLDPLTRTASEIVVWGSGSVIPLPVVELLRISPYSDGAPVRDASQPAQPRVAQRIQDHETPLVVEVKGSESDFEYQLPASPQYFVGRRKVITELEEVLASAPHVIVVNAQSGWGKSSLALRLKHAAHARKGLAVIYDSRTASHRTYVTAAVREAAMRASGAKIIRLPPEPSWGSLVSALETLKNSSWTPGSGPLLLFFDQFENVFRDESLTREFRNLALGIREIGKPISVGFAWKTDLVGWTENHPYQLRDEIRAHASVANLTPLGPSEVDTLLRRLEKSLESKLMPDLKQRLREYSQGLPWLFKKLAGHVLREVAQGTTQEALISEALNVQSLFEADLAELQPAEHEGLAYIAKYAPVPVSEVMDRVAAGVVQSLVDRRLIVQVGERLDTYWDTFRDFLTTGRIPIEDSFILRQGPSSVGRLLRLVTELGGDAAVDDLAQRLSTSEGSIYNLSRELRQLGLIKYQPYRVQVSEEVLQFSNPEDVMRERATHILKRHRAYSTCLRLIEQHDGYVTQAIFARALPQAFPAVAAAEKTWSLYARTFAQWFEFAGLLSLTNKVMHVQSAEDAASSSSVLAKLLETPVAGYFPTRSPGSSIDLLNSLRHGRVSFGEGRRPSFLADLSRLNLVHVFGDKSVVLSTPDVFGVDGSLNADLLRERIELLPGCKAALQLLESNPDASRDRIGEILRDANGASWSDAWTRMVGQYLKAWARYAGVSASRWVRTADGQDELPGVRVDTF